MQLVYLTGKGCNFFRRVHVSPELGKNCTGAWIFNGPENYYLSDHYPVMVELE